MEVRFPLLSQLMLHKTHHIRYVAYCKKDDIHNVLYVLSWTN